MANAFLLRRLRLIDADIAKLQALPDELRKKLARSPVAVSQEELDVIMELIEDASKEAVASMTELRRQVSDAKKAG